VSYVLVFLFTLGKQSVTRRGVKWIPELLDAKLCFYGVGIGVLNFAGYFLVLQAFGSGPISLSQAIFSSSILIPILLSRIFFHEKLTPMRLAAIALAMVSVVLISQK
jgi:drug/metabolite transporter (DMT)-like permease